jgi:2,3,4,5-tetrahydropyridine-2,6-dicarboxylate N-acetyltransferase
MNDQILNDAYQIAAFIKNSNKKTPVKLYIKGNLKGISYKPSIRAFGSDESQILFGEISDIHEVIQEYSNQISDFIVEFDRRNSAIPLLDITNLDARIEPGAWIRDFVKIGRKVVIMMGAIINIGAVIGDETMIDMNAVVGARAMIGNRCHIGAGAVVAGVLEPPSKLPVIIEDDVLVGANAVILEGVRVKKGAVIAAGAIVTEDVLENQVVAGSPAKFIKMKDQKTIDKTQILDDLRK